MTASEFVEWINKNAARVREYSNGGDGSNGKCDCIGLIIGAWRMSGHSWPWVHGSNYAARYLTNDLGEGKLLQLGDLVYKARPPGSDGYSLPERYQDGTDLLDYYHVGVVTGTEPLEITHCTSVPGGIKRDTSRGNWKYSGQFSKVDYNSEEVEPVQMEVWSENGKAVNLRNSYSTAAAIIKKVPCGAIVDQLDIINTTWARVKYGDKTGYMVREFLRPIQDDTADDAIVDMLNQIMELAEQAKALVKERNKNGTTTA